jgi:hypothetical protein
MKKPCLDWNDIEQWGINTSGAMFGGKYKMAFLW